MKVLNLHSFEKFILTDTGANGFQWVSDDGKAVLSLGGCWKVLTMAEAIKAISHRKDLKAA